MRQKLRTTAAVLTTILFATLLSSCGDSHDKVADDTMKQMDEFFEVVTTVKDKESADAATEKLDAIIANLDKIAERYKELGEPDEATQKAISEKFKKFGDEKKKEFQAQSENLGEDGLAIMMSLMGSMQKLSEVMDKMPAYEVK